MTYAELLSRGHFDLSELLAFASGTLVDDPPDGMEARLPLPPFLMFDRVTRIDRSARQPAVVAEQDVRLDAWYFQAHFAGDPVQPGCLGLDALWQLLGFYLVASGGLGVGRALGCKEVEFFGQVRPHDRVVTYELTVLRKMTISGATLGLADGSVLVDGVKIYSAKGLRVGIFKGIRYPDYPKRSPNSVGGVLQRG